MDKFVSIIVPTYRDWSRLALCIEALSSQNYPKQEFEVIIVNNDPADAPPTDFLLPKGFMIIEEGKAGSYAARNTGLELAKGKIIGFTDSDCIPDKDWIKNAVIHFENNPSCSRIAGKIQIFYKSPKPTMAELYNTLYSFPQQMHVTHKGTSVTGNLFTYRSVFNEVGTFNEKLLSLGDLGWGRRANKAGFQVHYVDNVIVKHPARSLAELIKKEKRVGGGQGMSSRGVKAATVFGALREYRPRLAEIKFIFDNGKDLTFTDKLRVLLMRHYLLAIRGKEKLKVQAGKDPNRA